MWSACVRGAPLSIHMFAMAHRSYDMVFKLKVNAAAEGLNWSKQATAHHFKRDAKRVREWCSQKEKLTALKMRSKCLQGAGRKLLDSDLEEGMFEWIIHVSLRSHNVSMSRKMIEDKAKTMMADKDPLSDFTASKGWLQLFLKRKRLGLRTTVCQNTPLDVHCSKACKLLHANSEVAGSSQIFQLQYVYLHNGWNSMLYGHAIWR